MQSPARGRIGWLLGGVSTGLFWLSVLLLLAVCALVTGQVVMRNFFARGLSWADELARFCGIALVFLSVPHLALTGQHIAVDLFQRALPRLARRAAMALVEAGIVAFCGLTLWGAYVFLRRAGQFTTPALAMPNLWFYMPAIAGLSLLALVSLWRLSAILRNDLTVVDAAP